MIKRLLAIFIPVNPTEIHPPIAVQSEIYSYQNEAV
jgi:hypothetical protein